jgi:WD40 repeat protein
VNSVVISADNKFIVSGSWDNSVRIWERECGELIREFKGHKSVVNSVAISADNKFIVSGSDDNTVLVWE